MQSCIEDIPHCEIFYPTWKEFQNFSQYVEKVSKTAKSGIFKVVPPKGWKARRDNYKHLDFVIPHPIEQIVTGKDGYYELILLQRESRSLSKYEKLVESFDKIVENKDPVDVEKLFWRTLKFSSPLYGADAPGSLFDKGVPWNLTEIESPLKTGLKKDITGVTTPYLYIGSWKAMFAWHKEDLDLYSINFLHFGKPKCWYGIPQEQHKKFEEFAQKYFSEASKECKEFLRHKTYIINPSILIQNGLTVNKCIQYPGEFVITKCAGYHAGFNMGFNCAEAVNFALNNWVEYGKKAGFCTCQNDTVKIDMYQYLNNIMKTKTPGPGRKKNTKEAEQKNLLTRKKSKKRGGKKTEAKKETKDACKTTRKRKMVMKNLALGKTRRKKSNTEKEGDVDNWLCCDKCNKWRKIPKNLKYDPEMFKNGFNCNFIKSINCNSPEEKWRAQYTTLKRRNKMSKNISKSGLRKYFQSMRQSINA